MEEFNKNMRTSQLSGGGVEVATSVAINGKVVEYHQKYDLNVPEAVEQFRKDFVPKYQEATAPKTAPLNKSLGLIVYQNFDRSHDAICFVGDLGQDIDQQAQDYMKHENIDGHIIHAYWHNALEDQYGNRYQPEIKEV